MTKPAPARLSGYFAKDAPVCIILRRGPSRYTLMIKWHTDTDVFEVGQWISGAIQGFSMSSTGSHASLDVMGGKLRKQSLPDEFWQYSLVCRPPYFSALEVRFGVLTQTYIALSAEDQIDYNGGILKVNAKDKCPFPEVSAPLAWMYDGVVFGTPFCDATQGPAKGTDQSGREILFDSGKIFAIENGDPRLLFDTNPLQFSQVEPPAWALTWNEMPEQPT